MVPAALADPHQVARLLQIGDDALDGSLGDADPLGDLAHPDLGLARQAQEDVGVVGEEGPGRARGGGWGRRRLPSRGGRLRARAGPPAGERPGAGPDLALAGGC